MHCQMAVWFIADSRPQFPDSMFTAMQMQRTQRLADWHAHDEAVLKEYTDLGGKGTPSCATAHSL
jgi:hypothetical protein